MKKILCAMILSTLLLITVTGCGGDDKDATNSTEPETTTQAIDTESNKDSISEDKAKEAALKHAGLKDSEVTFTGVTMDKDDMQQNYEVDFHTKDHKYDYEIDAVNGDVASADMEKIQNGQQSSGKEITEDKAKAIVTEKIAGVDKKDVTLQMDTDDGWKIFEGELTKSNKHYEFEIDAITGDLLKWSEERTSDK